MQIKIKNFGPIKSFDFDLTKDLVVIFGKNNTGKSYAISLVYLVLKNLIGVEKEFLPSYLRFSDESTKQKLFGKNENDIIEKKEAQYILKNMSDIAFIPDFRKSLQATFEELDSINSRFVRQEAEICLRTEDVELTIKIGKNEVYVSEVNVLLTDDITAARVKAVFSGFYHQDFPRIYYLPASRSGLYQALNAFSKIFAELSKNRAFFKQKVEIPAIPEPVSDYFLGLSGIKLKSNGNKAVLRMADEMEKNILKGAVIFDPETEKIYYKPNGTDLLLDMSMSSSMVSEIAPIVAYLKYIIAFAESETLVFIEEPEAHLHPEAQVMMMEMISGLACAGVKIVMSSHSNYMFNKLNNLILDGKIDITSMKTLIFNETDEGSVVKDVPVEKLGIDDENFLDVAEKLFNEKIELVEKLN